MISFKVVDEKRIPHILNSLKVFSFAGKFGWGGESDHLSDDSNPCGYSSRSASFLWINRWPLALVNWD